MSKSWSAYAAIGFTVVAWASGFSAISIALRELAPIPLAAARFAVAAVLILAWLAWRRPPFPSIADAGRFLLTGTLGIACYNIALNTGQQTVGAGAASFIVNAGPILTALLALVFLRERFTVWGWIGTLISFGGIAIIASGQPGGLSFGAGSTYVLAAAILSAVYFVIQKPLVATYGALPCAAYTLLVGALVLSPWLPEAVRMLAGASAAAWISVIALGVFPAALGYATWTYALGHFGAARAANFLYLIAPLALCISFFLTGEIPGTQTILGGLLAIAGVALVNTRGRP